MNKKKIAFLLYKRENYHSGEVRPFINWSKELSKRGHEVCILLVKCRKALRDGIKGINTKEFTDEKDVSEFLKSEKPDIFITDDRYSHMNLLMKSNVNAKTLIYVQILFAIHSIDDVFDLSHLDIGEKLVFNLARLMPFGFIKPVYKNLIKKSDVIICNSKVTANILHVLYGMESAGIISPPVDTEIFKPSGKGKKKQVVLYLGSPTAGDTHRAFLRKICNILKDKEVKVMAFGNKNLGELLKKEFDINLLENIDDESLAEIYSESLLTICPQRWENFGYVIAESVSCRTPALAFNYMGPAEIIGTTGYGFLANNSEGFLDTLENLEERLKNLPSNKNNNPSFDIRNSTRQLETVFKQV